MGEHENVEPQAGLIDLQIAALMSGLSVMKLSLAASRRATRAIQGMPVRLGQRLPRAIGRTSSVCPCGLSPAPFLMKQRETDETAGELEVATAAEPNFNQGGSMRIEINIAGLDKAEVLAALYNDAGVKGMGFLHATPEPMTADEARKILDAGVTYFDYLKGRVMKVDLSGDSFWPGLYDRDNGMGAAESALANLRAKADKQAA